MASIYDYFSKKIEESGIDGKSITRGTIIFGAVAGSYVLSLWTICYFLSPTKYIVEHLPWQSLKTAYYKANLKVKNSKMLKNVPEAKRGRLSISFGEMVVLKTILGPVALPAKIWLAVKLTAITQAS